MNYEIEEVVEEVCEKDRSAENKRRTDWRKAISRFNLIKSICNRTTNHPIGYYRNNNEANANTQKSKKTNTRKSSSSYKHKGGYGKANKYNAHDQRQLDSMNDNFEED